MAALSSSLRLGPTCPESEMTLIGALLQDEHVYPIVAAILSSDDFFDAKCRRIYESAHAVHTAGEPATLMTITHELRRTNGLEAVGSHAYLCGLVDAVPTPATAPFHAHKIRQAALARSVASLAHEVSVAARSGRPWQDLLDQLVRTGSRPQRSTAKTLPL